MATTPARLSSGAVDHPQLRRFLGALRVQLWWRDALAVAAASAAAGAVVGAAAVVWPARPAWIGGGTLVAAWVMVAALAVGALVAAIRRPTMLRAARVADRQLRTDSRLATATEVLEGRLGGALAPAQLDDAWRLAGAIRPWHAYPHGWRRVQLELAAVFASVLLLVLSLAGVISPLDMPWLVGEAGQPGAQAADAIAAQAADAAAAADALALQADPSLNPAAAAQTLDDLQTAAAQSQAAQAALQKLGDALRPTAAARDVGEALRAGNFDDAATKLNTLAKESDQLSRLSKRELATAMQRAAFDSAKLDPPLAIAEDRAGRALNRGVYTETKATLEDLAKAIGDAKKGLVSPEALAQQLDRLQQQQQSTPGGGGGDSAEYIPDIPGEQPNQVGLVKGLSSTIQVPGPEGDPKNATHSGVGNEAGGDPLGDLASRLNIPPVDISVDTQLANDQGHNNPNPQAPTIKISDTTQNGVRPSDVVQPGDPVQDVAEQTLEPSAQRGAVRTFFKSAGDNGTIPDNKAP
jgi:hypothetical protein